MVAKPCGVFWTRPACPGDDGQGEASSQQAGPALSACLHHSETEHLLASPPPKPHQTTCTDTSALTIVTHSLRLCRPQELVRRAEKQG